MKVEIGGCSDINKGYVDLFFHTEETKESIAINIKIDKQLNVSRASDGRYFILFQNNSVAVWLNNETVEKLKKIEHIEVNINEE
jgi:heptaprenylglyceryl phosphate synthase